MQRQREKDRKKENIWKRRNKERAGGGKEKKKQLKNR